MKRYTKGFTLIELLVVIAIIGILASVVLVSLNSARKKGNDTRVISDVNQIRTQLEADYSGGNYSNDLVSNAAANTSAIYVANGTGSSTINQLVTDARSNGGEIYVITKDSTGPTAYAVFGALPSAGGYTSISGSSWFCIGSNGTTNQKVTSSSTLSVSCQ